VNAPLQFDDARFTDSLNRMAAFIGDAGKVVKFEAAALVRELQRRTPPYTYQQGVKAVASDLKSVFFPINKRDAASASSGAMRKDGAVKLWVTKNGYVFYADHNKMKLNAGVSELERIHEQHRENGRVKGLGQGNHFFSKRLGYTSSRYGTKAERLSYQKTQEFRESKEVYSNRYVVDAAVFFALSARKTANVGTMKSGWGAAADLLGVRQPNWVKRAQKPRNGSVTAQLSGPNSFVEISNTTPGVATEMGHVFRGALLSRAASMERNLRRMIKYGPGKSGDYGYGRT